MYNKNVADKEEKFQKVVNKTTIELPLRNYIIAGTRISGKTRMAIIQKYTAPSIPKTEKRDLLRFVWTRIFDKTESNPE